MNRFKLISGLRTLFTLFTIFYNKQTSLMVITERFQNKSKQSRWSVRSITTIPQA